MKHLFAQSLLPTLLHWDICFCWKISKYLLCCASWIRGKLSTASPRQEKAGRRCLSGVHTHNINWKQQVLKTASEKQWEQQRYIQNSFSLCRSYVRYCKNLLTLWLLVSLEEQDKNHNQKSWVFTKEREVLYLKLVWVPCLIWKEKITYMLKCDGNHCLQEI